MFPAEVQNNVNLASKNISKEQPIHITVNRSDGHQQTVTGLDTTHHTNATVYNPPKNEETLIIAQEIIDVDQEESHPSTKRNINDHDDYKIGKLHGQQL